MSRDLVDESYYVSHGGKIPVKWTAPEVQTIMLPSLLLQILTGCMIRLCTTRSTPLLVMCGAMELSCMRYGVWGTNHFKISPIIR